MDVTRTDDVDINLHEIPIQALRSKMREKLSSMLNQRKLILSPEGYCRDYRGLAELMELSVDNLWTPNNNNPMASLLERSRHSLADLQEFLERIDRFDVLDDCRAQIYGDSIAWRERKNQSILSKGCRDEADCLTIDDILESGMKYDAFLLYDDADVEFAAEILRTLKTQYNLKICVKDHILGGAVFEHSAIMKLISERCYRLIVVFSDEFVNSNMNTFLLDFTQLLSLQNIAMRKRMILPVKYKDCTLPEPYLVYFTLDHRRHGTIVNFWEKLYVSVIPVGEENPRARITELPETNKPKCIENIATPIKHSSPKLGESPSVSSLEKPGLNSDQKYSLTTKSPISSSESISSRGSRLLRSTTKLLRKNKKTTAETVPNVTHHKTKKINLKKLFKGLSKNKSKNLAATERVACVS